VARARDPALTWAGFLKRAHDCRPFVPT
jgi:hypothetical protein